MLRVSLFSSFYIIFLLFINFQYLMRWFFVFGNKSLLNLILICKANFFICLKSKETKEKTRTNQIENNQEIRYLYDINIFEILWNLNWNRQLRFCFSFRTKRINKSKKQNNVHGIEIISNPMADLKSKNKILITVKIIFRLHSHFSLCDINNNVSWEWNWARKLLLISWYHKYY